MKQYLVRISGGELGMAEFVVEDETPEQAGEQAVRFVKLETGVFDEEFTVVDIKETKDDSVYPIPRIECPCCALDANADSDDLAMQTILDNLRTIAEGGYLQIYNPNSGESGLLSIQGICANGNGIQITVNE